VPEQRRANRVREKAKRGEFNVESGSLGGGTSGQASGNTAKVDVGQSFDPVSSLAHEVGHLADAKLGGYGEENKEIFEDETVKKQAEKLAVRRRPMASSADSIKDAYGERDYESEIFADAFAVATEEPRAAKREAPDLFKELKDKTIMDFGRF